jgi:hypothetical protein
LYLVHHDDEKVSGTVLPHNYLSSSSLSSSESAIKIDDSSEYHNVHYYCNHYDE